MEFACPCGKDVPYKEMVPHNYWMHVDIERERKLVEEEQQKKRALKLQAEEE